MAETTYTPGPWLRDRESGFDCDVRAANGRKIASVNVQNQPKSKEGWSLRKKENEANACLIAAAPELLEALQAMLEAFGKNGLGGEYDPGEVPAIDLALAATAKALGEQA